MKLIVLAHYGEAQTIIDEYSLSKKSEELYQNEEFTLLLTGEGPFEATARVSRALASGEFSEVINLGIAGALDDSLKINEIHSVRTIYLSIDGKLQYKSFDLSSEGVDLITSFERILDPAKSQILSGMGKMVDRESWGVGFACKEYGVPFSSYKIISDRAGTIGACEVVKDQAHFLSLKLLEKLKEVLAAPTLDQTSFFASQLSEDFYFTFSLKHKFQNLVEKIILRDQVSVSDVFNGLPLKELQDSKLSPKLRAKALVEELEVLLDPFKGKLHHELNFWKRKYKDIDLITDPSWENSEVKFSFTAGSEEELQKKIEILNTVELKPFYDILDGRVHVE